MAFWLRSAELIIGKDLYTLGKLNFSFEVPFKDSDEPPVATIKIMNLSEASRAGIKKNAQVILNAGYEGDIGCILIGKVVGLKHKLSNVDWTTTLTVLPCADNILTKQVNKTYKEKIKASAMVRDLLNIFGVEVSKMELAKDRTYSRGRVCRGKLKKVLTEIVVKECKSRLIIRPTGQLYITKPGIGLNNGILLTDTSGMLRSDEETEPIPYEKKTKTTTTSSKSTSKNSSKTTSSVSNNKDDDTISRSCLLNYQISTAELVTIQSGELNGKYTVVEGKHTGNITGKWETEMELKPKSTTKTSTKKAKKKKSYKVGDTVKFTGSKQYSSSSGTKSHTAKPGSAKITKIAKGTKHPYYLAHKDKTSNVQGWVNAGDFS